MSNSINITLMETADRGRYEAQVGDTAATAELTYRVLGENVIVAEHTIVPKAHRGMGIAAQLVQRLIADAREKGLKIVPQCSYVQAQFDEHPEWSDLLRS